MKSLVWLCLVVCCAFLTSAPGQDASAPASDASAAKITALQTEIDLLNKQKEYEKLQTDIANQRLKALLDAVKTDIKPPKNETTFKAEEKPSAEVSALSYEALNTLSTQIEDAIHPIASRYSGIVVYNEPDFLVLAKYRLYRHQSDIALTEYQKLKAQLIEAARQVAPIDCDATGSREDARCRGGRKGIRALGMAGDKSTGSTGTLLDLFSLPALATGLTGSIAETLAMFRSETIISESRNTVDESALATAMANSLIKKNPNINIFVPAAFVPEYDIAAEGSDSILIRISDINQAYVDVSEFLDQANDLPPAEKKKIQAIIDSAQNMKNELRALAIGGERIGGQPRALVPSDRSSGQNDDDAMVAYTDLRGLIRAEKLERFLRQGASSIGSASGPKVGVLKVRGLASGGSRRETRNLIFGNKIRYSGSLTFEVQLFDVDGTVRVSEIFSGYTGFRKFEANRK
jgi:hypothetical protein